MVVFRVIQTSPMTSLPRGYGTSGREAPQSLDQLWPIAGDSTLDRGSGLGPRTTDLLVRTSVRPGPGGCLSIVVIAGETVNPDGSIERCENTGFETRVRTECNNVPETICETVDRVKYRTEIVPQCR